jgi:PAS domain S-box-containing protein
MAAEPVSLRPSPDNRALGPPPPTGRRLWLVLAYALAALTWLGLSGLVLPRWFPEPADLRLASTVTGVLFALVSSAMLYGLVRRQLLYELALTDVGRQAHARHLQDRQLLEAIIAKSQDAIFAKGLDGRYLLMNARALQVLGKTEQEVIGKTDDVLHPPELVRRILDNDQLVMRDHRSVEFEHTVRGPHGPHVFLAVKAPLVDGQGQVIGLFGIARDITDRQKMDKALRDSEARYRNMIEQSPDAIVVHRAGRILYANPTALRMAGVATAQDALGRKVLDFAPVASRDEIGRLTRELFTSRNGGGVVEAQIGRSDGTVIDVAVRGASIEFDGAPAVQIAMRDISGRKRAQRALLASEAQLRVTLNAIPDLLFETDLEGRYLAVHAARSELLVAPKKQLLGQTLAQVLPPEAAATCLRAIRRAHVDGQSMGTEIALDLPQGRHWFELSIARKDALPDEGPRFIVISRDITAHKLAESRLQAALNDKDALLREVHHRVKNNLQVIDSLLRMETRRSGDGETRAVLQDMQGRIRAMAQLHEALYRSSSFSGIDLGSYIGQLVTRTLQAQAPRQGAVRLQLDLDSVPVEMDQATPCGLLVNELVSNCLKHGFPDGSSGEVRVSLKQDPADGSLVLQVSDNGQGLPPDWVARKQDRLGLQLANDLAGQLGGHLVMGPGPAPVFTLHFRADPPSGGETAPSA